MDGTVGSTPPGIMYVRALYDYEADDRTSLSFHEGDVIQVITQLESGWWDGVINGVRGWFPSNYCQIITGPEDMVEQSHNGHVEHGDDENEDDVYDESFEHPDDESEGDAPGALPLEGTDSGDKSRADFWIPQATPDGRLFYYNMMTGDRSMELPLESPGSINETGPRDRMNASMPDKTRPPAEMMARGLNQDEDDDSATSASEAEGDGMFASRRPVCSFAGLYLRLLIMIESSTDLVRWSPLTVHLYGFHQRILAKSEEKKRQCRQWFLKWPSSTAEYRLRHFLYQYHV